MIIAETKRWACGKYTVQQRPRPDNPAWPVYVVFHVERLIGKSFSLPDLACCQWLERSKGGEEYAAPSPKPAPHPLRGVAKYTFRINRGGRPTKAEQERRSALIDGLIEGTFDPEGT